MTPYDAAKAWAYYARDWSAEHLNETYVLVVERHDTITNTVEVVDTIDVTNPDDIGDGG